MLILLSQGSTIYSKRYLKNAQVRNWKFKNEFPAFYNDIMPGVAFKVYDISKMPGNMWVKVEIAGSSPQQYLKISGEEFAHNFRV